MQHNEHSAVHPLQPHDKTVKNRQTSHFESVAKQGVLFHA